MGTQQITSVVAFVRLAWGYAGGRPLSWTLYNQQVHKTCHIAAAGFDWKKGDLDAIMALRNSRCGIGKCLGENGIDWLYVTAIKARNMSACCEIERYLGRPPIIADGANGRQRDRLCLNCIFSYDGRELRVTSFREDGQVICVPLAGKPKLYRLVAADIKRNRAKIRHG